EAFCREERLRARIREASGDPQLETIIYYLSYRPDPSEAGPERTFDYSERSLATRWREGEADMRAALAIAAPAKDAELIAIRRQASEVSSSAAAGSDKARTAA